MFHFCSITSVISLVLSVLQFANPQIVNLLIDFVSSNDPYWKGYLYTVLIVLVTFMCTVLNSQAFYREYLVGLRIRTGLISAIYRKSLRLSNAARKQMTGKDLFYTFRKKIVKMRWEIEIGKRKKFSKENVK